MRKSVQLISILSSVLVASTAHAENWPSRLIKATIPFGAGSATDVVPRLVFDRLAAELGQPIVIENRAGAGGTLGTAVVTKADPDGYSILAHSSALTIAPAIFRNLTFDATKDLASVLMIGSSANVMIVPISRPWKTVQDFIADAKAKPGAISFGVFMPSKTPRDIVEKFHAAGVKVLSDTAMQENLSKLGVEALPMTPAEMDDLVKRETAANMEVIKAAGIK